MKKSKREDILQFLTCFLHPSGGISPSESHLLTCSKFFFTERNKASQNASFLQHYSSDTNCALLNLLVYKRKHPHSSSPLTFSRETNTFLHQRFFNQATKDALRSRPFRTLPFSPRDWIAVALGGACPHPHPHPSPDLSGKEKKKGVFFPNGQQCRWKGWCLLEIGNYPLILGHPLS